MDEPPELEQQVKVSKMLAIGLVFSIVNLAGIGSAIALILGLKSRKIIVRSEGRLHGIKHAWWCIAVGVIGLIVGPILVAYYYPR